MSRIFPPQPKKPPSKRQRGQFFEDLALAFLEKKGHKLIQKNFRTTRSEIDLILENRDFIVFVEVKYRTNLTFGYPAESVNQQKIKRIRHAASCFFQNYGYCQKEARFDVIGITPKKESRLNIKTAYDFDWIKNAF